MITVKDFKQITKNGKTRLAASVTANGRSLEVWYEIPRESVTYEAEAFLVASLVPAMKAKIPLHIMGSVSRQLLDQLPIIQQLFCSWYPHLQSIPVQVDARDTDVGANQRGIGCFFSGGVDSFYTLLKHREEITYLVFVHGFDIRLENTSLRREVSQVLRQAAVVFEKPLLEVETNLRSFADAYAEWGPECHGAALASVALLLAPTIHTIYIPSSHYQTDLSPWGSHPLLDPLWSTEELTIKHDACEVTRVEKAAYVAQHEEVLKYLRVCWENRGGAYNCGRCEKCLRTMINLRMANALERCQTFRRSLDLALVARIRVPDFNTRAFVQENLDAVVASGKDPDLADALRDALGGLYYQGISGWPRRATKLLHRLLT